MVKQSWLVGLAIVIHENCIEMLNLLRTKFQPTILTVFTYPISILSASSGAAAEPQRSAIALDSRLPSHSRARPVVIKIQSAAEAHNFAPVK